MVISYPHGWMFLWDFAWDINFFLRWNMVFWLILFLEDVCNKWINHTLWHLQSHNKLHIYMCFLGICFFFRSLELFEFFSNHKLKMPTWHFYSSKNDLKMRRLKSLFVVFFIGKLGIKSAASFFQIACDLVLVFSKI